MPTKTKAPAPAEDTTTEITELEKVEVDRVDGVSSGANGFPILMMKAIAEPVTVEGLTAVVDAVKQAGPPDWHPQAATLARLGAAAPAVPAAALFKAVADGVVNEQPDIDGGQQAIELIAKLIGYEADEVAAGCYGETYDIGLLVNAIECLKCWLGREEAGHDGQDPDSPVMAGIVMDAAKAAPVLPAVVPVAEETKSVDTDDAGRDKELLKSLVSAAVTEATKGAQEELQALRVELAKVKATPIPGGPVMSIAQPPAATRDETKAAKAAKYRRLADEVSDPDTADAYRQLARDLEETTT